MEIIKLLVGTDGVHIGVDAVTWLHLIVGQRQTLPFCQRVHHFRLRIAQIFNGERHGTFRTAQIVVDTQSSEHKKRTGHAAQLQSRSQIFLKEIFDNLDALLCFIFIKQRLICFRFYK